MKKLVLFFILISSSLHVFSEDIELYLVDSNSQIKTKPQVLLIVDTSGSMAIEEPIKTPFNPALSYKEQGGGFSDKATPHIYYTVGPSSIKPSVDSTGENRRFSASINNCTTAAEQLNIVGFYTGRVREYITDGSNGSWQELNDLGSNVIVQIDCEDDINLDLEQGTTTHNSNQFTAGSIPMGTGVSGYPINATPGYGDDISLANPIWGGKTVTLYTDNYLRWDQGSQYSDNTPIGETDVSRLDIAKETLKNLINSIPSVDFGLEVYNINTESDVDSNDGHGGRIAFGIKDMTEYDSTLEKTNKEQLLDIIKDELHASGSTPLCESYYEAYRYFAGESVGFGDDDFTATVNVGHATLESVHTSTLPDRDTDLDIESGGTYISPYKGCSDTVFVILITDGIPQNDSAANTLISGLQSLSATNATTEGYVDPMAGMTAIDVDGVSNSLPLLAGYMSTNDINASKDGKQTAQLYTIGFSDGADAAAPILTAAAVNGGGEYYSATDPTQLGARLQEAIASILQVDTSFTAPTVVTDSSNRTETLDSVYYAMFKANNGARWSGNLKKLKITDKGLVDRGGALVITEDGSISSTAKTFWQSSEEADGNKVEEGGVVGMFNNKTGARTLYSNSGSSTLNELNTTNLPAVFGNSAEAMALLGVDNAVDAKEYLEWIFGIETSTTSGSTTTFSYRPDLFGDPLHSKPVAINYGVSGASPDVRILVGTNAGMLHMFQDHNDAVKESWAFMPKELMSNITALKDNLPTSSKVYGVDGKITTHIVDVNGNGIIDSAHDKVLIFFGLRRGGNSYYGLDITVPDTPKLLWKIDPSVSGFEQLGQTWSQPQVGYSSINIKDGKPLPVLVFGAGYSTAKDLSGPGGTDTVGLGIYMVDAATGALKWSATPASASDTNTQYTDFTNSIPSRVAILDSDGDGLIDRLYTGDTGGNIFRVDMPGNAPNSTKSPWTVFKLAELGATTGEEKTNLNDRRFFNAPSIVRTFFTDTLETTVDSVTTVIKQETPYDAILIGSGDRSTPASIDTNDEFFMIQDMNVITQSFDDDTASSAKETPTTITYNDLYDFTDNPFNIDSDGDDFTEKSIAFSTASGWRYSYTSAGEKSTAGAIAVDGIAYFTSFTPGSPPSDASCDLFSGEGSLYAIDLYKGINRYDWRKRATVKGMPDTPVIGSAPSTPADPSEPVDDDPPPGIQRSSLVLFPGGKSIGINSKLKTSRLYQYVTEQN